VLCRSAGGHGTAVGLAARQVERLEDLGKEIEKRGGRAASVALDVTYHGAIENALGRVESALGPIDILINNAGVAVSKAVLEQTEADWDKVLDIDLKGAFFTAQAVARRMVARVKKPAWGGAIVNIASVLALDVVGYLAPYAASKGGLWQLTLSMALELARDDVRVNALARATSRPRSTATSWRPRPASACEAASRSVASASRRISTAHSCSSPRMRPAT
jgi:NAD(P)-dependent dehydrogenase (short-subunit alcohol dehydrogenase family)